MQWQYVTPVLDVILLACIGYNVRVGVRLRRAQREVDSLLTEIKERLPVERLVEHLDTVARNLCPLCGDEYSNCTLNGGTVTILSVAEELDGWHTVMTSEGENKIPCIAAPLRQLNRRLFDDLMKEAA